ncbi:hypothetical protein PTTG_29102 [Puccinia triticina 1-1 BBBD Race 1]|uniref:F-box domain-containing protein n=2 Tax=Puccinia triticina TaxID=208348 RepID=A0A180G8K4_PUCT1|nr:uncharacterized protein PtA15_4A527 [Puccinia triticina]OAV88233.1 hypothetical protein PTTG_29102 [Puccinia triticina 1-1 BBBD Race 1]WAQ84076.1 hypothetical protein PtA15_4A527 [Puccinia triticina]WAR54911.1 hypothetical protein PtB15_4B529 [Puccinia triticina]
MTRQAWHSDLLNLALVNRTFYEICSQLNWEHLDLYYANLPRLSTLNHEIIHRHSWRVKHIIVELDDHPPHFFGKVEPKPSGIRARELFQERRSSQVYDILQSCTNLTRLTLDIEPRSISIDELGDFAFNQEFPSSQLLKPISQLCNLTCLNLRPPMIDTRFEEDFVVRLIKGMVNLVHFDCNGIDATFRECKPREWSNSSQVNVSPLALHLSSLSSLKTITFTFVHCFDSSWSRIKWKAALGHITIDNCNRATVGTLHSFCMLFTDSLESLCVSGLPTTSTEEEEGTAITLPPPDLQYNFCLPRLECLAADSCIPFEFLTLFREAPSIKSLFLGINPHISLQELKGLMDHHEPIWPNLKYLTVEMNDRILSNDQIEELKGYGSKSGVQVSCEDLTEDLDGSEEEFETEMEERGPPEIREAVGSYTW